MFGQPSTAFAFDEPLVWFGPDKWDVGKDGRLLLMIEPESYAMATKMDFVTNWFEDLRRLVPRGQ